MNEKTQLNNLGTPRNRRPLMLAFGAVTAVVLSALLGSNLVSQPSAAMTDGGFCIRTSGYDDTFFGHHGPATCGETPGTPAPEATPAPIETPDPTEVPSPTPTGSPAPATDRYQFRQAIGGGIDPFSEGYSWLVEWKDGGDYIIRSHDSPEYPSVPNGLPSLVTAENGMPFCSDAFDTCGYHTKLVEQATGKVVAQNLREYGSGEEMSTLATGMLRFVDGASPFNTVGVANFDAEQGLSQDQVKAHPKAPKFFDESNSKVISDLYGIKNGVRTDFATGTYGLRCWTDSDVGNRGFRSDCSVTG